MTRPMTKYTSYARNVPFAFQLSECFFRFSHSSKQTSDFLRFGMFYVPAVQVIVAVIKVLSQFVSREDGECMSLYAALIMLEGWNNLH